MGGTRQHHSFTRSGASAICVISNGDLEERTRRWEELRIEVQAYASVMSEHVREPLRRIRECLHLLERRASTPCRGLDDGTLGYFQLLRDEAARAEAQADDLRGMARLEHRELRVTNVNLRQLLVQVHSDFQPLSAGRDVRWTVGDVPNVQGISCCCARPSRNSWRWCFVPPSGRFSRW